MARFTLKKTLSFVALALCATPTLAAPPHVHGQARLEIALEGQQLTLTLETPLDNLLGFEHAPRTQREKQAVAAMRAKLQQPEHLFSMNAEARCTPAKVTLEASVLEDHAHDEDHAHGAEASAHNDLDAEYQWTCAAPQRLQRIGTRLFAEFPNFSRLHVEFIGDNGQKAAELSAQQPELLLHP